MNNLNLTSNIKKIKNGFSIKKVSNIAGIIGVIVPLTFVTSSYQIDDEIANIQLSENTITYSNIQKTNEEIITESFRVVPTQTPYINPKFENNPVGYTEDGIFYFNPEYVNNYLNEYVIEEDTRKLASLTFDDGPSTHTIKLLELLDEYKIKATFFVIGRNIEGNEEAIIKAYQNGHEIAIHTYNHEDLTKLSIDEVKEEILKTKEKLESLGIRPSNLVRPPYGKVNQAILENIDNPIVTWNVDTEDWKTTKPWKVRSAVLDGVEENAIILLHDGRPTTIEGLKNVLPLINDEYKFVTVSNLFKQNEQELESGIKYRKVK